MISIDKLISSISNLNEKELKFVPDNIFTQKTTYQILKDELLRQKQELEGINNSTKEVIQHYSSDFKNKKADSNQSFQQFEDNNINDSQNIVSELDLSNKEPTSKNVLQSLNSLIVSNDPSSSDIPTDSLMIYNENDTVDLPEIVSKIVEPYQNNFYLFGFKNPNSLIKSIMMVYHSEFILKSKSEKENEALTFIREMAVQLNTYYKKYNYKSLKFNKNDMLDKLLNHKSDYSINLYICDYIKNNFIILDIVNKTFRKYINNTNNLYYVIVYYNGTYLPLMNSNGNHYVNSIILENVEQYYNQFNDYNDKVFRTSNMIKDLESSTCDVASTEKSQNKNVLSNNLLNSINNSFEGEGNIGNSRDSDNNDETENKKSEYLKIIKNYNLKELQNEAAKKGIDIYKQNKNGTKMINKTKTELIDSIYNSES